MLSMYEGKDVTKCSSCLFWLPLVLITGLKSYSELLILDTAVHILKKIICDFIFVKELWSSEFLLILLPLKKAHFITDHVKLMLCPSASFWVNPVRRISCAYAFKIRLPTANCSTKRKDRQPPLTNCIQNWSMQWHLELSVTVYCLLFSVVSPYSFSIGDTSEMEPYLHGGIAVQVKTPKMCYFVSVYLTELGSQALMLWALEAEFSM